jgi:RNA polymerase sigma factor (sigma-70 family)
MAEAADFERLMTDVASGSEEAIWELAETYTPYILRAVRVSLPSKVRPKLDSQDFAQALWASILLNRKGLTRLKTPQQLIAFLAASARNKVIDATRRYMRTQKYNVSRELSLADVPPQSAAQPAPQAALCTRDPTPSQFASVRERWTQILLGAPDLDREILRLRLEGSTFEEIAADLQISQATARRAIQHLIDQLSQ